MARFPAWLEQTDQTVLDAMLPIPFQEHFCRLPLSATNFLDLHELLLRLPARSAAITEAMRILGEEAALLQMLPFPTVFVHAAQALQVRLCKPEGPHASKTAARDKPARQLFRDPNEL